MKRSSSAPSLAEDSADCESKRIRTSENNDEAEPSVRDYLQMALGRIQEMQRSLDDDQIDETSDLDESENEDDVMHHVLSRVFCDLPEMTSTKIAEMIESGKQKRRELSKIHEKKMLLSGYEACRKAAIEFMKDVVRKESLIQSKIRKTRESSVGKANNVENNDRQFYYKLYQRMFLDLDLHLCNKHLDFTKRLLGY